MTAQECLGKYERIIEQKAGEKKTYELYFTPHLKLGLNDMEHLNHILF